MLKDEEVVKLKEDERYKNIIKVGLKNIGADIVRSSEGEFRPDVGYIIKFIKLFIRARVIRHELTVCVDDLLGRFICYEMKWPRMAESIGDICGKADHGFIWMRYDLIRVNAVLLRAINIFSDPKYRSLIKEYSTIEDGEKNDRLTELVEELKDLHYKTKLSIKSLGVLDGIMDIQKEYFYKKNKDKIPDKIINSFQNGFLGTPAKSLESKKNE